MIPVHQPLPRPGPTPPPPPQSFRQPADYLLAPETNPGMVVATDIEPSPDYATDHTVYMVGDGDCGIECHEVFRSSDGGATWTFLSQETTTAGQLLLPPSTYGADRWYMASNDVIQETTDGGAHFGPVGAQIGFATTAPAGAPGPIAVSDENITFFDQSNRPHLVDSFPAGYSAVAPPLFVPAPGYAFAALQLVEDTTGTSGAPDLMLRCDTTGCTRVGTFSLSGFVYLMASPAFASDHTVLAYGQGVWVSHDGGASFARVSDETLVAVSAVAGPRGVRLVADDWRGPSTQIQQDLTYSDDWGATWQSARLSGFSEQGLNIHAVSRVSSNRVVAQVMSTSPWTNDFFVCSDDGATWTICTPT